MRVSIEIMDNEEWEPDEEFYVELYELKNGYPMKAKDTRVKITILDDDNSGILSFQSPIVKVSHYI